MRKTIKMIALSAAMLCLGIRSGQSQSQRTANTRLNFANYVFNADSLSGFDQAAAEASAISEGFTGNEFPIRMWTLKRQYINSKYNINNTARRANHGQNTGGLLFQPSMIVAPACQNEDFEASTPGIITLSTQIAGWTVEGGNVQPPADACNPNFIPGTNPSQSELINCPSGSGYIDPNIGGCYPIYSVFGNGANSGAPINPQVPIAFGGTKVIRINNNVNDFSAEKLSKTFAVTPANAVFQFAFMSVFATGHGCCQAATFKIQVIANGSVLTCPQFSVGAPSGQCTTVTPMPYYIPQSCQPMVGLPAYAFSKWFLSSLDLTAYIGQNVTLGIAVTDCNAGGHWGEVYFDAQCLPMDIIGNGNGFPAGTPSITLPTCGANGATITAPAGLGPYSWSSQQISIPAPLTVPNQTNQTLVTAQSGTLQLTMNPPGSCAPIIKIITVTITPAPVALISATQAGCTNTLSAAQLTCAGSASVGSTITWSPSPLTLSGNSLTANGLPIGITTVNVVDPLGCKVTLTLNMLPAPPPVTFQINNLTGSYTITCINPTINLQAVSGYTYGTLSYTWSSPSFSSTSATVGIDQPMTLTVLAVDPATGCQATQTVAIGIFTTQPTNSVSPTSQAITCNSGAPVTFSGTVSNPTVNIQHDWYSPLNPLPSGVPIATSNNTISILSGAIPPGTYTLVTTNLVNGCKSQKTVTVTSLSAWPTFNLASPTNFSLGCSPINCTTLSIINPVSTQTPPATCSFSFLAPSFTGVVTPSVQLGAASSTVVCTPGTWTVIVQDNSNFCRTTISVPVLQNTVAPNVSASVFTQTLTCYNPTVIATGTTSTPNSTVNWLVPSVPPFVSSNTLVIGDPANGPNTGTTSLSYATFTVVATNSLNSCQSTSLVVFNQNFKLPISNPTISIATPTAIYCTVGQAPVVLTTGSSTTTSGGGPTAFVANPCWSGPSPQTSTCGPSSYSCYVPGVYTLEITDNYNGCKNTGTVNVFDRTQPPVIASPLSSATLDCGGSGNSATLSLALTGTMTGGVRYLITEYPLNVSFSPNNAAQVNINPLLAGTSNSIILVDKLGDYEYVVSNTLTGCQAYGTVQVIPGGLVADIAPDVTTGYAPLTVGFQNLSHSAINNLSITSVWNYGNGTSLTTTNTSIYGSAVYAAPGSYTVTLIAKKGTCLDTTYKIILVDIPSKLDVPNVFTPNGDGNNDVFFLKASNLSNIEVFIIDRWGNKVYETTSTTGNIAWDGKNFHGKECASGVYFYVIKAEGKDGTAYEKKGNVSLFR
jgi:gliding motility-associated-like protein